ncbi:hypothetical protein [Sporosarcina psychrophila]|uniref:hypothetical protein n=1 Tax=Sporosarcina psychrophila TaxID=1476 RepID=UPI00078D7A33|nr:hypothetical protein [Sporosarcina psychrophila]AMQ06637.1 hypothetical protein AZE41_12255 [Sporosarcina psychrophila]
MRFLKIESYLIEVKNEIIAFKKQERYLDSKSENNNGSHGRSNELEVSEYNKKKREVDALLIDSIQEKITEAGIANYFRAEMTTLKQNKDAYTNTEFSEFDGALKSILSKLDLLFHVESLSRTSQGGYNYIYGVKLPQYEYFDDVAEFTKQLNLIFSIVMNDTRKVKLVGFDKGSEWYQVALDNLTDFKMMALFISEVTKWVKIIIEDKLREDELDIEEDARRLIVENMKANQLVIKNYAVKRVLGANDTADDSEEHTRCQMAFERMANLMIKGTKVEIDKQDSSDDLSADENEETLVLPNIEDIQGLLEIGSDLLIEHNPSSEDE